ncbi:MAG: SpoIID/LytB domain-containing protein, partial [Candidatus Gracilibacteria bacterium]
FDKVISFPEQKGSSLAKLKESSVKAGGTGTFTFKVKADQKVDNVEMKIAVMANGKTKIAEYFELPVKVKQGEFSYQLIDSKLPPASMEPGETFEGWVKLENTGNNTWRKSGNNTVFLAADHERGRNSTFIAPAGQKMGVLQEKEVKPGETGTFNLSLKAPDKMGFYKEYFTPVVDWKVWMTDTEMNFETLVGGNSFDSETLAQAPNKKWQRGESYNMWVNIRNMGTSTWTNENIKLTFIKEADLKISKAKLLDTSVAPGKVGRVGFTVTVDSKDELGKKTMMIRPMIDGNYISDKPINFEYTTVVSDAPPPNKKTPTTKTASKTSKKSTADSTVKKGNGTEGDIRIKLTFTGNTEITASGDFEVKSGSESLGSFTKDDAVKVEKSGSNYKMTAGSKTYTKSSPIRFIPDDGSILKVNNFTRTDNEFREILEVNMVDGNLVLINELGLENYMRGLAEEPNDANAEMIKTIAVAARSYAKYYMDKAEKFPGKPYDLEDSPATSQKYLGYTFEKRAPNVVKAVDATKGQMVTYKGVLVKTPYFSKSDGTYTKSYKSVWGGEEVPYLVPVDDSSCKSTAFAGHGVGLSGCGAAVMANKGSKYVEILKYYYTGVEVTDFY